MILHAWKTEYWSTCPSVLYTITFMSLLLLGKLGTRQDFQKGSGRENRTNYRWDTNMSLHTCAHACMHYIVYILTYFIHGYRLLYSIIHDKIICYHMANMICYCIMDTIRILLYIIIYWYMLSYRRILLHYMLFCVIIYCSVVDTNIMLFYAVYLYYAMSNYIIHHVIYDGNSICVA